MPTRTHTLSRHAPVSRRDALKSSAFAAALAAAAPLLPAISLRAATETGPSETAGEDLIIDTHQHLWDLSRFKLPWLDNAPEVYRHSYRTEEFLRASRGLNTRTVYMEVDVSPEQQPAEAEYAIDLCRGKRGPTLAAVIGGRPGSPGFEDYVKRYKDGGYVRGVRHVLQGGDTPSGACLRDEFVAAMKFLGRQDLCFDLCMRPAEIRDALQLSERCPDTRFVLDHCGNADPKAFMSHPPEGEKPGHDADAWKRDVEAIGKRPNVVCKISGIVARAPEGWSPGHLAPIVNHCLDAFGPDRVVFGGDWPVCLTRATYRQWVDALRQITSSRPPDERRKLWSANARRFYALEV